MPVLPSPGLVRQVILHDNRDDDHSDDDINDGDGDDDMGLCIMCYSIDMH